MLLGQQSKGRVYCQNLLQEETFSYFLISGVHPHTKRALRIAQKNEIYARLVWGFLFFTLLNPAGLEFCLRQNYLTG